MSIALIIPDRKLDKVVASLQAELPGVEIDVWPDIKDPSQVSMAVLWKQPEHVVATLPNIKALHSFGAGVDGILSDPTLPDLPLARIVDPHLTQAMLQYLQTVVQFYQLRFDTFIAQKQQAVWKPRSSRTIATICVLGLGELGAAAAQHFARLGFNVHGWSSSRKSLAEVQCFAGDDEFAAAVAEADLVICLLPLTAQTADFLDAKRLAQFKSGAMLVNVARGAIVVDADLLAALENGQLSAACLDVFRVEPLPVDHPFWQHPNILLTPHISAVTNAATAVAQIAENYRRVLADIPMLNLIDKTRGY